MQMLLLHQLLYLIGSWEWIFLGIGMQRRLRLPSGILHACVEL